MATLTGGFVWGSLGGVASLEGVCHQRRALRVKNYLLPLVCSLCLEFVVLDRITQLPAPVPYLPLAAKPPYSDGLSTLEKNGKPT